MTPEPVHTVLLLRHAKSDWDEGVLSDFDRPLSRRGRHDAPRMGQWMRARQLVPDVVVSSPARRAKDTALLLGDALGVDTGAILWDERIYGAGVGHLLQVLEEHMTPASPLLLVGHNPGLDDLIRWLATERPATTPSGKLMTTCALARLEVPAVQEGWTPAGSRVVGIYRPREVLD